MVLSPDISIKITIATELRDTVDMYQRDFDQAKFFDCFLPCFLEILKSTKPTVSSGTAENVGVFRLKIGGTRALILLHYSDYEIKYYKLSIVYLILSPFDPIVAH